jgi:hypothetical protein
MVERSIKFTAVAIVVGVAAAGALVWAATRGSSTVDCNPHGSGNTPLGAFFALSSPSEESVGLDHWYNFTVQTGLPSLHLGNLDFEIQNAGGETVVPGANWTLEVWNVTGAWVGTYSLTGSTAGTWASGATFPIYSQEIISLLVAPGNIAGDVFVVVLSGNYSNGCPVLGSVSVAIP